MTGAPFDYDVEVMLDFIKDAGGNVYAQVSRKTTAGKTYRRTKSWKVDAIQNRDSDGLEGFARYARKLCIDCKAPGATLANLIEQKYRQIPPA